MRAFLFGLINASSLNHVLSLQLNLLEYDYENLFSGRRGPRSAIKY
jgi:hypothetical protein